MFSIFNFLAFVRNSIRLTTAVSSINNLISAKFALARTHIQANELDLARNVLAELSKGKKKLNTVHFLLAEIFVKQGQYQMAVEEYEAGVLNSARMSEVHPELLEIANLQVDDEAKVNAYKEAIALVQEERDDEDDEIEVI